MMYFVLQTLNGFSVLVATIATLTTVGLSFALDNDGSDANTESLKEYCMLETFQPTCLKNEVVVINRALYGRRRVGKCIKETEAAMSSDYRFIGCSADVQNILNVRCSGLKHCEIRVPDAELEQTEPCHPGLKMFLEVSYSCVEVVEEDRSCMVSVTSNARHIARPTIGSSSAAVAVHSDGLHCGTKSQPWLLEAPAGQRINISLLDFTSTTVASGEGLAADPPLLQDASERQHGVTSSNPTGCAQSRGKQHYGYVIDKSATGSKKNVSVCGRETSFGRISNVFLSSSNVVELVLFASDQNAARTRQNSYLLKVEAVGCSNLVPPEDAWIKREDENIIIGCYTSRQTWQLRCLDGKWIGVISNCSQQIDFAVPVAVKAPVRSENYQVAAVVAIGFVGLACCLIIICCGVVCLHRFYAKSSTSKLNTLNTNGAGLCYNEMTKWPPALKDSSLATETTQRLMHHGETP